MSLIQDNRYCVKVNPGMANRMVDSARVVLNKYLPDVYIYTDCSSKGANWWVWSNYIL